MSADTSEQDPAGGNDLRARYLPVSRKELRRRREAEFAARRAAHEDAEAASDQLAAGAEPDPQAPDEAATASEDELARTVEHAGATEALELPGPPSQDGQDSDAQQSEDSQTGSEVPAAEATATEQADDDAAQDAEAEAQATEAAEDDQDLDDVLADVEAADEEENYQQSTGGADAATDDSAADAPEAELPQPAQTDEPARPEEDVADAAHADQPDVELSPDEVNALTAEQDEQLLAEDDDEPDDADDADDEPEEFFDDQDAPIPASRRGRRLLRETESLPKLPPELLAELNETTGEIAKHDDPNRVDPELLKKQQALAAKAMQANQERLRQQQAESAQQEKRWGRQRPESEVITGKTLRDSAGEDSAETEFLTGQIEPIQAQSAHGLELNEMMDETSRLAGWQNTLLWLVVILAVLLLVAVVVILFWQ